uniref:Uncharacterized protein n=1 Tax=Siphoviridae sp. ctPAi1 TaxID=2826320 RepID=A0A8S5M851_9CAUD|nr:MAG TPA: hypothetical protein [Siphoviridae sp. ctPAi1]
MIKIVLFWRFVAFGDANLTQIITLLRSLHFRFNTQFNLTSQTSLEPQPYQTKLGSYLKR